MMLGNLGGGLPGDGIGPQRAPVHTQEAMEHAAGVPEQRERMRLAAKAERRGVDPSRWVRRRVCAARARAVAR